MALRSVMSPSFTPTATADTSALANNTYLAVFGATATQKIRFEEIYMGGQAGASSPTFMLFSRDSTIPGTPVLASSATDAAFDPATAALANVSNGGSGMGYNSATTSPQRSSTLHLLNLTFNAFGGLIRWNASPNERELGQVGNTASLGDTSLSAFTGGTVGAIGAHIIYEPF